MRIFTVLGILFYAGVLILIGMVLIIFSLNILQPQDIETLLTYTQTNANPRIIVGLSGILLIVISLFELLITLALNQKSSVYSCPKPDSFNQCAPDPGGAYSASELPSNSADAVPNCFVLVSVLFQHLKTSRWKEPSKARERIEQ